MELPENNPAEDASEMPPDPFTLAEENATSLATFYRWLRSAGMPILGAGAFMAANVIYHQQEAPGRGENGH